MVESKEVTFNSFDEFMEHVLKAFPQAVVEEDNERQLIIYTGLMEINSDDNPSIPQGETLIIKKD